MTLEDIRVEVENLYSFRDNYYQEEGPEKLDRKEDEIEKRLQSVISHIDDIQNGIPPNEKGELFFLKGRAWNVGSEYNSNAEMNLRRAIKFNIHAAWNEMGECLYKNGDLKGAQTCFNKALNMDKNKVYLRNMSMLMRSLPWNTQKEREDNIAKGLQFAKDGLQKDFNDGESWLVLGNSYLASFFTVEAKLDVLKNCKSAYIKAENDPRSAHLPELHYSKFQIEWYEEDYKAALSSLKRASELEPTWQDPKEKYEECRKFLVKLSELAESKGQLGPKKLAALVKNIKTKHLGPYETGGTGLTGGEKPSFVPISLLAEGTNHQKIILGKVVCTVIPDSGLPFAFCIVDKDLTCRAVTVYNWATNCGVKIGDSVAIVAPVLRRHNLDDTEVPSFVSVRVCLPLMLIVNKRVITADQVVQSVVVSSKKID